MGIVFSLIGAFIGGWVMSASNGFFGFVAGLCLGWLLHRLLIAQSSVRQLQDRVAALEQRETAQKSIDAPLRVTPFQPTPVGRPEAEPLLPTGLPQRPERSAESTRPVSAEVAASKPAMGAHTIDVAKRWLTTGNVPVKVGVLLSFFGVAFLLKYAVEQELFSIPMSLRYLGVAGFAAFLLAFGWRKRTLNRVFALSIQGGGIGVLFLTVFAAFRLHGLLSPTIAFGLLVVITAAAGVLAIKQESRAFAILGTTGGFLAPLLASTGSGNHIGLFGYYLVLNCAVLGVAWYRSWRELNIVGFGFTFGVGTIWGYQYYVPALFASTEPFLVLYFLFYTAIAILFAFRAPPKLRGYVDGTLLFGTPTIAFALQTQLLNDTEYGLAISAAVVSGFYASLALWLGRMQEENFRLLAQAFIALAVAFGTIAIPLALDDRWTAIAWALEGAALIWIGVRQATTLAKMTGAALPFAAGVEFIDYGWVHDLGIPVLNGNFSGGAIIALASLFTARLLRTDERGREWQSIASIALLAWGLGWWFGAGSLEIFDRVPGNNELHAMLLFVALSLSGIAYAGKHFGWLAYSRVSLALLPALAVGALAYLFKYEHFFRGLGTVGWLVAIAAHIFILYVYAGKMSRAESVAHGLGAMFFVGLLAFETGWQVDRFVGYEIWPATAALAVIAAGAFALFLEKATRRAERWPFSKQSDAYLTAGMLMMLAYVVLVAGFCIDNPGNPAPLPYIPLLNPLDLLSIVAVALAWYGLRQQAFLQSPQAWLAGTAFVLSTIAVVRVVYHTSELAWRANALMNSVGVQSTLSIYWAILGLGSMILGTRRANRSIWMSGAGLMIVVVLKLFLVDLGNTGTVARIISFHGVGVMLLVVGYFSPVPPRTSESPA
jgi:uncharacterized membrane protein